MKFCVFLPGVSLGATADASAKGEEVDEVETVSTYFEELFGDEGFPPKGKHRLRLAGR